MMNGMSRLYENKFGFLKDCSYIHGVKENKGYEEF